jgi:hypothetical protein
MVLEELEQLIKVLLEAQTLMMALLSILAVEAEALELLV